MALGSLDFSAAPGGELALAAPGPGAVPSGALDFRDPPGGELAFGTPAGPSDGAATLALDADIGALDSGLRLGRGHRMAIDGDIGALDCDAGLVWDANVSRGGLRAELQAGWQQATPQRAATRTHWQQADVLRLLSIARWQEAAAIRAALAPGWQDALHLRAGARSHWQQARPRRAALDPAWQEAGRLRHLVRAHWQQGMVQRAAWRAHWQETLRLRHAARTHWQPGSGLRGASRVPYGDGLRTRTGLDAHWQQAWRPRSGSTQLPPPPNPHQPCYDPADLGKLQFWADPSGLGVLAFWCEHDEPPPATLILARRRTYIVINSIEVRRVDTDQVLPALDSGFAMQLERGSWSWGFTVNFHATALPLLQPGADGLPVELQVKVNGQLFRMLAEQLSRSVQHPRAVVQVRGASPSALLDAPYAPQQSFTQPAMRTAQQLMLDVLTVGGVSMGWTLDWQITDWTLPAGTWAHQGSWISAINDIAGSVGAYVQPHDTAHTLRILPAWPVRGWLLPSATPDIELPPGVAAVEEVEWLIKPAYDGLYLRGEPGTYNYFRKRSGTPGTTLAPQVVHPLLVDAAAAAQRAIAELSDTGRQVEQQLQLMVHPETGIIKPGTLLRYTDDAAVQRTGITRAVSVQMAGPKLTQTLRVQAPEPA